MLSYIDQKNPNQPDQICQPGNGGEDHCDNEQPEPSRSLAPEACWPPFAPIFQWGRSYFFAFRLDHDGVATVVYIRTVR